MRLNSSLNSKFCHLRRTRSAHVKWRDLMNIKETKFEVEKSSILLMSDWGTSISSFCKLSQLTSTQWADSSLTRLLKPTRSYFGIHVFLAHEHEPQFGSAFKNKYMDFNYKHQVKLVGCLGVMAFEPS